MLWDVEPKEFNVSDIKCKVIGVPRKTRFYSEEYMMRTGGGPFQLSTKNDIQWLVWMAKKPHRL